MNLIEERHKQLKQLQQNYPSLRSFEEKSSLMSTLQKHYKEHGIQSNFYVMPGEVEHLALISEGIEDVDRVFVTHVDSPAYVPFFQYKPLNEARLEKEHQASVLVFILVFILLLIPFIFLASRTWSDGVFNLKDVVTFAYFVFLLFFFQKYHQGFSRKNNRVRNHSSVLALMNLASYMDENNGFAFIDKAYAGNYGLKVLLDQNDIKGKEIVYLDSIGSGDADFSPLKDLFLSDDYHEDSKILAPFRFDYREASAMSEKEIAQNIVYAEEKIHQSFPLSKKTD